MWLCNKLEIINKFPWLSLTSTRGGISRRNSASRWQCLKSISSADAGRPFSLLFSQDESDFSTADFFPPPFLLFHKVGMHNFFYRQSELVGNSNGLKTTRMTLQPNTTEFKKLFPDETYFFFAYAVWLGVKHEKTTSTSFALEPSIIFCSHLISRQPQIFQVNKQTTTLLMPTQSKDYEILRTIAQKQAHNIVYK